MNPLDDFLAHKNTIEKSAAAPGQIGPLSALWKGLTFQKIKDTAGNAIDLEGAARAGQVLGEGISTGALMGGIMGGANQAYKGISKILHKAEEKYEKPRDYKAMLAAHPELKKHDAKDVQMVFNSLRHMSPTMSKDPLVAGSYIRNVLAYPSEGGVAVPTDTVKMLTEVEKNIKGGRPGPSPFMTGFQTGLTGKPGTLTGSGKIGPSPEDRMKELQFGHGLRLKEQEHGSALRRQEQEAMEALRQQGRMQGQETEQISYPPQYQSRVMGEPDWVPTSEDIIDALSGQPDVEVRQVRKSETRSRKK